mgnify:CR=1 FL=1
MNLSVTIDVVEKLSTIGVGKFGSFFIAYIFIYQFVFVPVLVELLTVDILKAGTSF